MFIYDLILSYNMSTDLKSPEPITVILDKDTLQKLDDLCNREHRKRSEMIRVIIMKEVK